MGIYRVTSYNATCDSESCPNNYIDRNEPTPADLEQELEGDGWLRRGKKWYCPDCRVKHEPKRKPKSRA